MEGGCLLRAVSSRLGASDQRRRRADPKRARENAGRIQRHRLWRPQVPGKQSSSGSGAFWNLPERPVLTPSSSLSALAGAVYRRRARGRRLDHLPRRHPQPQGGERGACLAARRAWWDCDSSTPSTFSVRGNGVRFDLDLESSACVQVGAPDPAFAGGGRAGVRWPLLPPQRDLGPQIMPLRSQDLLHSLHVW